MYYVDYVTGKEVTRDALKVQLVDLLLTINPGLSEKGRDFLVLCSEIIKDECPFVRSGGAAYVAARVLEVPEHGLLRWMRRVERMFKGDRRIAFRFCTPKDVFLDFLVNDK